MSEFIDKNEYHLWFDSIEEMESEIVACEARANPDAWRRQLMEREYNTVRWLGCEGGQLGAVKLIREGSPELATRLRAVVDTLKTKVDLQGAEAVQIELRKRKRHRMDYGDTLDMQRVWSGELDKAWERPVRTPRLSVTDRYATVFVDVGMAGYNHADAGIWRAGVALCIVEILTSMGINTEIWVGDSGSGAYEWGAPRLMWNGVRVKEYTQPLNDDRLATMTSAMFLRTWGFRLIAAAPWRVNMGYGMPHQHGMVKPLRDRQAAGERVFRIGNCLSMQDAIRDVQQAVTQLSKRKEVA